MFPPADYPSPDLAAQQGDPDAHTCHLCHSTKTQRMRSGQPLLLFCPLCDLIPTLRSPS